MYTTGNLRVFKDKIDFSWIPVVLPVHIQTLLLGTQFSEKNSYLAKKPPALEKSMKINGTIFPIILERIANREKLSR